MRCECLISNFCPLHKAAPMMLKVLKRTLAELHWMQRNQKYLSADVVEYLSIPTYLEAAIAKAEGR